MLSRQREDTEGAVEEEMDGSGLGKAEGIVEDTERAGVEEMGVLV